MNFWTMQREIDTLKQVGADDTDMIRSLRRKLRDETFARARQTELAKYYEARIIREGAVHAATTEKLKAARQHISLLKQWNYALTYGASPHTAAEIIGAGADQYIEVDYKKAEARIVADFLRYAGIDPADILTGYARRRFLWGD